MLADRGALGVDQGKTLRHCVRGKTLVIMMVILVNAVRMLMIDIMLTVNMMITVSPLQDLAGFVDHRPKLTNLDGNNVDHSDDADVSLPVIYNDNNADGNLVYICSHPALRLVEPKLGLSYSRENIIIILY